MSKLLVHANEATATQRRVYFHLVDPDGMTPETGEAGGQPQVSSDGGAWTNTGIGTLSAIGNGRYYADLTQTLVQTAGTQIETRYKSANTAECPGDSVQVVAFDPNDAVRLGLTALPAAAADAAGGLPISDAGGLDLDAKIGALTFTVANKVDANMTHLAGGSQSAIDLKDFADDGYDPSTNKVQGVVLVDTTTTNSDMRGTDNAALASALTTHDGKLDTLTTTVGVAGAGLTEAGGTGDHLTALSATLKDGAHGGTAAVLTLERIVVASTTTNEPGVKITGNGSAAGINTTGGSSGHGLAANGGASGGDGLHAHASFGSGISAEAHGSNGAGVQATGDGTGSGLRVVGGAEGSGLLALGGATSGDGIRAAAQGTGDDIDADITGNMSGSVGSVTAGVTLANDAITAAKFDESTAFPLTSADSGSTAVARTGADSDTLETLSDQLDGIAADLPQRITKNTALSAFEFTMVDEADHVTGKTGLTITATRSLDGGAFGACANSASEVSNGVYKIDLAAGDLNGNTVTLKFAASGADTRIIHIVTQPT